VNPLRWPIRVARAGLFLAEEAVAGESARGAQLSWIAENLLALAGVQVEFIGDVPDGVLILPAPNLLAAAAVLACGPVDAVGPSLARLPGLGHAAVATTPCADRRILITSDDDSLMADVRPSTPRFALRSGRTVGGDELPGFLRAAARPITHLRVRIDAVAMRARAA
jgi:hypothetical protein